MIKKKAPEQENNERWLVSYADFMTLLFAFFVVMFASTQADKNKAKDVSESVRQALEHGQFSAAISTVLGRGKHQANKLPVTREVTDTRENNPPPGGDPGPPADLKKSLQTLQSVLEGELKTGKVGVKLEARGLVVSLREAAFFASGDDTLAPNSLSILEKISAVVQKLPNPVRLEGHTDSIPIHNSRFRNNWELSSARAIAMLEILSETYHVPRSRMAVGGYAENMPADSNDTEEGRAHNRRVDVVLLTQGGMLSEPHAATTAGGESTPAAH